MPKFIIKWDAGFGENYECGEADDLEDATEWAHQEWLQEAQSNASYEAIPLTQETAAQYGYESELDE